MCWNTGLPNSLKYCNITAITPFRVTDFGTNRKFIYDSLLVINTDLPLILHKLWMIIIKFSLAKGDCLTLTLSLGVIPCQYRHVIYR